MNEDTNTIRCRTIDNRKKPPENGWVVVESTLFFVEDGDIKLMYGLAGESRDELILSAQRFCPDNVTLYDDKHNFFHAETSWKKRCLAQYDPDLYLDDE